MVRDLRPIMGYIQTRDHPCMMALPSYSDDGARRLETKPYINCTDIHKFYVQIQKNHIMLRYKIK